MQTISSLSSQSLFRFQARGSGFCCRSSLLNPRTTRASAASSPSRIQIQTLRSVASASSTQIHLSNLEKLLQNQIVPNLPEVESLRQDSDDGSRENKATNLLEGLNLSKLWPQMKAAEDMSPTHLNRLKRLLSKSQEYSPRNSLGQRWREYHGSKDWAGMLDPLDENLRREVVRHGEFIQAAYHAFHSDPATSEGEGPVPRHVDLPDRSYKVTKSLYATSSVGLPAWVDDVAPDLGWMTQRSSWIGYVAVCDDQREISRMGRRDIVIALRGTATCLEWAENVRNVLVPVPGESDPVHAHPKAEAGFLSLFKTRRPNFPSLAESVVQEVRRLMDLYKGETLSITVTGHSLGAALALLVSDELSTCAPAVPPIAVFSFGGPRVGNRGFANRLNQNNVKVLRVVNSHDVITRVPGIFVSEGLERKARGSNNTGVLDDKMPWAYSHVGTELRVDSKMSPYLKPNADVACCHDLEAYLHLVDGYLASNCPFRANAKRSLARLLSEQGSNVKKLYISKVKALKIEKGAGQIPTTYLPSPS